MEFVPFRHLPLQHRLSGTIGRLTAAHGRYLTLNILRTAGKWQSGLDSKLLWLCNLLYSVGKVRIPNQIVFAIEPTVSSVRPQAMCLALAIRRVYPVYRRNAKRLSDLLVGPPMLKGRGLRAGRVR